MGIFWYNNFRIAELVGLVEPCNNGIVWYFSGLIKRAGGIGCDKVRARIRTNSAGAELGNNRIVWYFSGRIKKS